MQFEARNAEDAVHLWSAEASRAGHLKRQFDAATPASLGEVPVNEDDLADIRKAVEQFETAVQTLLGAYTTALYRERSEGPQQQINASAPGPASGWQTAR